MHQARVAAAGISRVLDRFPYDENIACRADGEGVPANPEVPSQICWDP